MMKRYVSVLISAFALLVTVGVGHAANVLTITGPQPFGFYNQIVMVEGWSQTVTYSNVSITMPLVDQSVEGPIGGVEGTVYLVNQIGPGTTSANEVAPPVSVSGLTDTFALRTLFSGLTLPPGHYYVVLASTNSSPLSMSPEGSGSPSGTPGVGVTELGSEAESFSPAPYPPATDITPSAPGNLFINVTGDLVAAGAVAVPALDTVGIAVMVLCLAGAALYVLRRRRA
ncbi:MAG: hypothetical protein P8013_11775 [Candidatus Sulfobium sp.]